VLKTTSIFERFAEELTSHETIIKNIEVFAVELAEASNRNPVEGGGFVSETLRVLLHDYAES
jgi:hypothetical protein